jgi:FkbH-like protein
MTHTLTLAEIENQISKSSNYQDLPSLKIHILRNLTVEAFSSYIKYDLIQLGYNPKVIMGEYGQIVNEAISTPETFGIANDTNCVIVFMNLKNFAPQIWDKYIEFNNDSLQVEFRFIETQITTILKGIRERTNGIICWIGFESPVYPPLGILEDQGQFGLSDFVNKLNNTLLDKLRDTGNAYMININRILLNIGAKQFYDKKMWHIAKALYSRQAQSTLAEGCIKIIRACTGKNKKVLVLDCDNTLWGGVVGEDGISGIRLGDSFPGSCYKDFQKALLGLFHRGIILTICSKNNPEDVWSVFENHPGMVLQQKNIAAYRINWEDKATNIQQIAKQLNLGIDSFVFIDDSEFEVNLVRQTLPVVETICLSGKSPSEYADLISGYGLFDQLTFSEEDKNRGTIYKAEVQRNELKDKSISLEDYLQSLEMVLDIRIADESYVHRISQLTQRTNQFNLTAKRYSESEISEMISGKEKMLFVVSLKDRFGDTGIIGACIVDLRNDRKALIDTFLLSCRVLGRGVETAFLLSVISFCRDINVDEVFGKYCETKKNIQVKHFYTTHGFTFLEHDSNDNMWVYSRKIDRPLEQINFQGIIKTIFNI